MCRVLKFVSNNAEKHFRNWEKDGTLLVTSMPTDKEVLAMAEVLWNERATPHPWQRGELTTPQEKSSEIENRIHLVGPIPRLVFDSGLFIDAIGEYVQGAVEAAEKVSDFDLYKALRGKYSTFLAKHPASASSRLLFLNPQTVNHSTWEERRMHRPTFQLTPIAIYLLRDRLEKGILALRKDKFEDFAFDRLCETEGRRAEIQYVAKGNHSTAFQRITSMNREELRVYRPTASNFPFVDFVTSRTTWYIAKSTGKEAKTLRVDEDGARTFLDNLENAIAETNSFDDIKNILRHDKPVLTVLINGNAEPRLLDPKAALDLFGERVIFKVVNVSEMSAVGELLNCIGRTQVLLDEFEKQVAGGLG